MPNTASAKKRIRQTVKRNALNTWRKRQVKESTKAFLTAVHDGKLEDAETLLRKVSGLLDRFATKSTFHRNTAARKKGRLAKRLKTARATKA